MVTDSLWRGACLLEIFNLHKFYKTCEQVCKKISEEISGGGETFSLEGCIADLGAHPPAHAPEVSAELG